MGQTWKKLIQSEKNQEIYRKSVRNIFSFPAVFTSYLSKNSTNMVYRLCVYPGLHQGNNPVSHYGISFHLFTEFSPVITKDIMLDNFLLSIFSHFPPWSQHCMLQIFHQVFMRIYKMSPQVELVSALCLTIKFAFEPFYFFD